MNRGLAGGHSVWVPIAGPRGWRCAPLESITEPRHPMTAQVGTRNGWGCASQSVDWPPGRVFNSFCSVQKAAKAEARRGIAPAYGRPSLCSAGALTKTGVADCNKMSVRPIAASCIRHNGGNDGFTTVAVPKSCTRNWRKGQSVDAKGCRSRVMQTAGV